MRITNKYKKVGYPDGFHDGTSRLVVCNKCFPISKKLVRTKTHQPALAAGGAK